MFNSSANLYSNISHATLIFRIVYILFFTNPKSEIQNPKSKIDQPILALILPLSHSSQGSNPSSVRAEISKTGISGLT